MVETIPVKEFLDFTNGMPIADVRSPGEFQKGHIPGAINICLFTDEERAQVGTLYHQKGRDEAVNAGLELVAPKLTRLVDEFLKAAPEKKVLLYCQRGGMRSSSIGFLLRTAGFETMILQGGYKAYRTEVLAAFTKVVPMVVLGGMTGSGKTKFLNKISEKGYQTIDLEGIACHRGSVFGAIGQKNPPSSEHFGNLLFQVWSALDFSKPLLIEDEGMDIGSVKLPEGLFRQIRKAPLICLDVPREQRIQHLVEDYAGNDDELLAAIQKLEKRLGNVQMLQAVDAVKEGNYAAAASILLMYYDKSYKTTLDKNPPGRIFDVKGNFDELEPTIDDICNAITDIFHEFYEKSRKQ
jgi:tRNA 2-selenouridine synthase